MPRGIGARQNVELFKAGNTGNPRQVVVPVPRPVVQRDGARGSSDKKQEARMRAEHDRYLVLLTLRVNDPGPESNCELDPRG